jgi:hypothetical protein
MELKTILSVFIIFLSTSLLNSQETINPDSLLKKELPVLFDLYNAKLEKQRAHYIFAVDISSSMRPYEATVKNNIVAFIKALPDGDEVTLVQKASTANTDFISFRNTVMNDNTRQQLEITLRNISFNQTGSDGYKMTEKIIESITQTGSSTLVYVFLFTDFEYWTHENRYNKNAVNWQSLKNTLSKYKNNRSIYATGLRLPFNVNQSAVYEHELISIFPRINFISVSDSQMLNRWFANTKANILRDKLKYIVENELKDTLVNVNLSVNTDGIVNLQIDCTNFDFIQSIELIDATISNQDFVFTTKLPLTVNKNGTYKIGRLQFKSTIVPFFHTFEDSFALQTKIHTNAENEIILLGLDNMLYNNHSPIIQKISKRIFTFYIPFWLTITLLTIITIYVLLVFYAIHKNKKIFISGTFTVRDSNYNEIAKGTIVKLSMYQIGIGVQNKNSLYVQNADWRFSYKVQKYNPLFFWKKHHFIILAEEGRIMYDNKTLSKGQSKAIPKYTNIETEHHKIIWNQ